MKPRLSTTQQPIAFGRYTLMRRIGAGGMGEVFLARENALPPRACVVKKVLPDLAQNRAFVGRFIDESKVVVHLNHPNIARVYEMGEVFGEYYLAMEYVQGKTVSRFTRRLREKKRLLPLGLILLIGERVCQGLAYAHDAVDAEGSLLHLVHRDLSPANVCISYSGQVKIIDFGAAQSRIKQEQTAPRVVIGNLTYMSPEQARKQRVDRRADVYSVGVMLWEMLSMTLLPQKGDPVERWRKAANPLWEPPSLHNPALPKEVDKVILKALSKDKDKRWPSAADFGRELQRLREEYAPAAENSHLGKFLSEAFPEEKRAEDSALALTLQGEVVEELDDDTLLVPPNALAFEHTVLVAPLAWEGEEVVTDRVLPPPTPDEEKSIGVNGRVGFGVPINRPLEESAMSLLQEIEAMEPGAHTEYYDPVAFQKAVAPVPWRGVDVDDRRATLPIFPATSVMSAEIPKKAQKKLSPHRQAWWMNVLLFVAAALAGFSVLSLWMYYRTRGL